MTDAPKNPDRHATKSGMLARPDPDLKTQAQALLKDRGWTGDQYLVACLWMLVKTRTPDELLKWLAQFKPPPKPRGRPKKST